MTETVQINKEEPEGLTKGEDGYFTIQTRVGIGSEEAPGILAAVIKLNHLPEGVDLNDPEAIKLTLNTTAENSIGFPIRGFSIRMVVNTVDTGADLMVFNLTPDNPQSILQWHMDHIGFVQIQMQRSEEIFTTLRPGESVYITVDFSPTADEEVTEDVPGEPQEDDTASEE